MALRIINATVNVMSSNTPYLRTTSKNFDQEVQLYYQLQYDLSSQTAVSAEALLRVAGKNIDNKAPFDLLNRIETEGSMKTLTYWVINQALADFTLINKVYGIRHIAINISAKDFRRKDLVKNIEQLLNKNKLPGSCLELEITEKLPITDLYNTVANINTLRAIGVGVVIDDFGTGYTSLPALVHMPVRGIKLDKMFCDHMSDIKYRSIAESLVYLTNKLNMSILIEGIEHTQLHNTSLKMGISLGQGYYYHKPQPLNQLITAQRAFKSNQYVKRTVII